MANESGDQKLGIRISRSERAVRPVRAKTERPAGGPERSATKEPQAGRAATAVAPVVKAERRHRGKTVVFGSVKIQGPRPSRDEVARNVEASNSAFARAAKAFIKPGVKLRHGKNIPLYSADPDHPHVLIRKLNGRSERVILVDGEFKPAE
jgi:hypothetical protein